MSSSTTSAVPTRTTSAIGSRSPMETCWSMQRAGSPPACRSKVRADSARRPWSTAFASSETASPRLMTFTRHRPGATCTGALICSETWRALASEGSTRASGRANRMPCDTLILLWTVDPHAPARITTSRATARTRLRRRWTVKPRPASTVNSRRPGRAGPSRIPALCVRRPRLHRHPGYERSRSGSNT